MSESFAVKDSGKRQEFASGMVRDVTTGKTDYSLVLDGPMFERWAVHLTKGAEKYAKRNWMQANGEEERARFKESALRHFLQWYRDERDEDHAAAVLFNINGAEYVRDLTGPSQSVKPEPQTAPTYDDLRSQYEDWPTDELNFITTLGEYVRNGAVCCNARSGSRCDCSLPVGHGGKHCDTGLELHEEDREWL